ncbi:MAG TPA: hypothetical protein VHB21_05665 [Minicystis sp.]|nr:hypothetical protein [Minicystis sp.]
MQTPNASCVARRRAATIAASLAAWCLAVAACDPPPPAVPRRPVGELLPPLLDRRPTFVQLGDRRLEDDYAWLDGADAQRVFTSVLLPRGMLAHKLLKSLPVRGEIAARERQLPAGFDHVAQVQGTDDGIFYLAAEGQGGAAAPRHVMVLPKTGSARQIPTVGSLGSVVLRASPNGKLFVLGWKRTPIEKSSLSLVDVATGQDLGQRFDAADADELTWSRDSKGFYYPRFDADGVPTIYHHVVGELPDRDHAVFGQRAPAGASVAKKGVVLVPALGDTTLTVAVHTPGAASALYSLPLADVERSDPPWHVVPFPDVYAHAPTDHGDAEYYYRPYAEQPAPIRRLDLTHPDAPAIDFVPAKPGIVRTLRVAADAVYVDRDAQLVRYTTAGEEEPIAAPSGMRLIGYEARSSVGGARAFYGSCLKNGWFAVQPGERSMRPIDLHEPAFDASTLSVERGVATGALGASALVEIVSKAGTPRDKARPAVVFPHRCDTLHPARLPWLEHGGVIAFCDVSPVPLSAKEPGTIIGARRRQAEQYLACARYVASSAWSRPGRVAARAEKDGGLVVLSAVARAPELFGAVAVQDGLFDLAHAPRGTAVADFAPRTSDRAELGASAPYLELEPGPMPPFFLQTFIVSPRATQSAKLAAKLESFAPDQPRALLVADVYRDDGHAGPSGLGDLEADTDAFLLWQLTGAGASSLPAVVRDDVRARAVLAALLARAQRAGVRR